MAASGITNKTTLIAEPNQTLFCIIFKVNRQNYMFVKHTDILLILELSLW